VRSFIESAARHPVEAIQSFTSAYVPVAPWVRVDRAVIPDEFSKSAAQHLANQLGPKGIEEVGGNKWWQWRKYGADLTGDWIEMQKDFSARGSDKGNRVLLYLHGGAYYFGSTDEHRYQIQRHARKLKARAFAPRYRLAPQFPFPCGLHDCLTAYLYLLSEYDPSCILLSGDSAGGGMSAALLVILRDQGIPLPAGAMLLSPWVDLTHSFPSILGDGLLDYIPIHGFVHRPSLSWPPPPIKTEPVATSEDELGSPSEKPVKPDWIPSHVLDHHVMPCVELNGEEIIIKEQIQLYAANHQLVNPLVSSVLNPSLGGLCPLLIQVGGGELISDEQVYFAHKAANPTAYPPSDEVLDRWDPGRTILNKYPPTNVQLQVWNDVCHVPHTLAWTKPAKYMYRSVAQFGAWALARAQQTAIDIDDDEDLSVSDGETPNSKNSPAEATKIEDAEFILNSIKPPEPIVQRTVTRDSTRPRLKPHTSNPTLFSCNQVDSIGIAGDPLPPFVDNMIRQRVDRHGNVYPLGPPELFFSLQLLPTEIGVIKEAPVHRWLERQHKFEKRFAHTKQEIFAKRARLEAHGLPDGMEGEKPPPTALVRRWKGEQLKRKTLRPKKQQEIMGLRWWSGWGSKQDEKDVRRSN
jgi:acetyl esterase/lipase